MQKKTYKIFEDLTQKEKYLFKFGIWTIIIVGVSSVIILPRILTLKFLSFADYNETGGIGDTINGIASPFIALLVAILTFLAFFIQYKANEQQRKDLQIERFENKFYEMLRIHRENIDKFKLVNDANTISPFEMLFTELKDIFTVVDYVNQYQKEKGEDYIEQEAELCDVAYKLYFYGCNQNSHMSITILHKEIIALSNIILNNKIGIINWHKSGGYSVQVPGEETKVPEILSNFDISKLTFNYLYPPYNGHYGKLGHIYRHLFQTVKFIANQKEDFLDFDKKLEYLSLLRAQLSNHEQLLLYYNGLSIGKKWFKKEYFTKYKMIHNIPIPLANFGIKPKTHPEIKEGIDYWHSKGKNLFEWDEY